MLLIIPPPHMCWMVGGGGDFSLFILSCSVSRNTHVVVFSNQLCTLSWFFLLIYICYLSVYIHQYLYWYIYSLVWSTFLPFSLTIVIAYFCLSLTHSLVSRNHYISCLFFCFSSLFLFPRHILLLFFLIIFCLFCFCSLMIKFIFESFDYFAFVFHSNGISSE